MSILNFSANQPSETRGRQASRADLPAAKVWLNVGYEQNGRFVNLPFGIPVDTMEALPIRGQNEEWNQFQTARNELLEAIQQHGDSLEAGAEVTINLTVKLRKVNEEMEIKKEDNPFSANLSSLLVG